MADILFEYVKSELLKNTEPRYQKFSSSLNPGVDNILGVRLPILRKIAKNIIKDDWKTFLLKYKENFMEETLLKGLVITYLNEDFNSTVKFVEDFVIKINNWAVCDSFCMGLKFVNKNRPEVLRFLKKYLNSKDEFKLRFVFVTLLAHFIDKNYIDEVLKIYFNPNYSAFKDGYYYTKMAVAWGISVCYVKFPKETLKYLENNSLDNFTHNKAISKIIESFRVSKEDKEKLKPLRRK